LIVPRFQESAVSRNRVKRRVREAIRTLLLPDAPPIDLLVRASKSAYRLSFGDVREEVARLAQLVRGA
jgi:ribonuclease P protein component